MKYMLRAGRGESVELLKHELIKSMSVGPEAKAGKIEISYESAMNFFTDPNKNFDEIKDILEFIFKYFLFENSLTKPIAAGIDFYTKSLDNAEDRENIKALMEEYKSNSQIAKLCNARFRSQMMLQNKSKEDVRKASKLVRKSKVFHSVDDSSVSSGLLQCAAGSQNSLEPAPSNMSFFKKANRSSFDDPDDLQAWFASIENVDQVDPNDLTVLLESHYEF